METQNDTLNRLEYKPFTKRLIFPDVFTQDNICFPSAIREVTYCCCHLNLVLRTTLVSCCEYPDSDTKSPLFLDHLVWFRPLLMMPIVFTGFVSEKK